MTRARAVLGISLLDSQVDGLARDAKLISHRLHRAELEHQRFEVDTLKRRMQNRRTRESGSFILRAISGLLLLLARRLSRAFCSVVSGDGRFIRTVRFLARCKPRRSFRHPSP